MLTQLNLGLAYKTHDPMSRLLVLVELAGDLRFMKLAGGLKREGVTPLIMATPVQRCHMFSGHVLVSFSPVNMG